MLWALSSWASMCFLKTEWAYETHQINPQWNARLFDLLAQMSGVRIKIDSLFIFLCSPVISSLLNLLQFKQQDMQASTASRCMPLIARLWNWLLLCHGRESVVSTLFHVLHLPPLSSPSPSSVFWLRGYEQCVVDILHMSSVQNLFSHQGTIPDLLQSPTYHSSFIKHRNIAEN